MTGAELTSVSVLIMLLGFFLGWFAGILPLS